MKDITRWGGWFYLLIGLLIVGVAVGKELTVSVVVDEDKALFSSQEDPAKLSTEAYVNKLSAQAVEDDYRQKYLNACQKICINTLSRNGDTEKLLDVMKPFEPTTSSTTTSTVYQPPSCHYDYELKECTGSCFSAKLTCKKLDDKGGCGCVAETAEIVNELGR